MGNFFEWLDRTAGIEDSGGAVTWLERTAFIFLVLTFASAPHSIAATQTAWIIGMLAWIVRLFFRPRVRFRFGVLDSALWGLFAWSVISSLVSYEPAVSLDKLRGAAVFLIFYFSLYNIRTRTAAAFLALVMIGSTMVNVLWMPVERLIGRGVEIHGLAPDGPLAKALLWEGDTLLEVNRRKITTPEEAVAAIEAAHASRVKFYRPDFEYTVEVRRSDLLVGTDPLQRLGITRWEKSHNWRSKGFYGHYTTYAEVLQLIGSLAFGLLIAVMGGTAGPGKQLSFAAISAGSKRTLAVIMAAAVGGISFALLLTVTRAPQLAVMLAAAVGGISFALLLTVTRAPQLAFILSAAVIVLLGLGRKWLLAAALIMLPLAAGGLIFLQQSRGVDFFDSQDESTRYRQMMWRDGVRLWSESPRHMVFGVGMDSIKDHWQGWGMFEGGKQPLGHFHSTPLQLAVERGLPALVLWLLVLGVYGLRLFRGVRGEPHVLSRGILLGCLGGAFGFFVSGLVHYNLGDQEVAMVFFLLMGLGLAAAGSGERGDAALSS